MDRNRRPDRREESDTVHEGIGFHLRFSSALLGVARIRLGGQANFPKSLVARGQMGLQAKNVTGWMIWESGTKSLREIGEFFSGLDYAAVAQRKFIRHIQSRRRCCAKAAEDN